MKLLRIVTQADFDAAMGLISLGQASAEDENLVRAWLDRAEVKDEQIAAATRSQVAQHCAQGAPATA